MCAFGSLGFCSWGRQIVIAFLGSFFFFKFRVGVGKTGLSGLAPTPLVLELLGAGGTAGGASATPFKASV